jgi:dual specificity MAP kinase phosphatase
MKLFNHSLLGPIRPNTLLLTNSIPRFRTCLSHPSTSSDHFISINNNNLSPSKFASLPTFTSPPTKRLRPQNLNIKSKNVSDPVLTPSSIYFIDSRELADKLKENSQIIIFDCGSPLRHSENSIKNSHLLRVSDKISRKRLKTNPTKHSIIDIKQLNQSNLIILYDDNTTNHQELSAGLKCAYEEIQHCLTNKSHPIYILQNSFNHFLNLYPNLCQTQPSINNDISIPILSNLNLQNYPMTEILDGLFIGSESNAQNLDELSSEDIRYIVNVTSHVPLYHSDQFHYYHIPADDTQKQNLLDYFDQAYTFISNAIENNEKVLVHCVAGISRSPAIVISFLMRYAHMNMNDAYEFVKTKRSIVSPNLNFMGQLLQYEQKLKEQKYI